MYKVKLWADFGCLFDRPDEEVKVIPYDEFLTHAEANLDVLKHWLANRFEKEPERSFTGQEVADLVRGFPTEKLLEKYRE